MFASVFHIYLCQNKREKRARDAREIRLERSDQIETNDRLPKTKTKIRVGVRLCFFLFFVRTKWELKNCRFAAVDAIASLIRLFRLSENGLIESPVVTEFYSTIFLRSATARFN